MRTRSKWKSVAKGTAYNPGMRLIALPVPVSFIIDKICGQPVLKNPMKTGTISSGVKTTNVQIKEIWI